MALDFIPKGWEVEPSPKVATYAGNQKFNNPKMGADQNGGGSNMSKGMSGEARERKGEKENANDKD